MFKIGADDNEKKGRQEDEKYRGYCNANVITPESREL